MDELVGKIVEALTASNRRLSAVTNPDGFLLRDDTQKKILSESGLLLLPIKSSINLRVRYELVDKFSNEKVCYIVDNIEDILPDIKSALFIAPTFTLAKLMPAYEKMELLQSKLTFDTASFIYNKKITRDLSVEETRFLMTEADSIYGKDTQETIDELKSIDLNWEKVETIEQISNIVIDEIKRGTYHKIESTIDELNENYQDYLDKTYFSLINSSSIQKPKIVHKILPYLTHKHQRSDKVVLIVVDGMSYWQYLMLDKALKSVGIHAKKDITFAYLPSITKLSRQAIFKGKTPDMDYVQSPREESRLWTQYWTSLNSQKQIQDYEIEYVHGSYNLNNYNSLRQAIVDTSLDEKMHSSHNNKDLYALTANWVEEVLPEIKKLHSQGFQIYITTDHGNVFSNPWRLLDVDEKVYLYEKESRGKRHLIYSKPEYLQDFLRKNEEIREDLFIHDNWAIWRNAKNFSNVNNITHGGAHFLETIIPFITIEKK